MSIIPQAPRICIRIWCYAILFYIKTTDGLNLRKIGNVLTDWSNWVSVFLPLSLFFLCLCLNCKRNKRSWSVPVCLQCLNNVKRLSLFVLAWNFTKRAKFAHSSKSSYNLSFRKILQWHKSHWEKQIWMKKSLNPGIKRGALQRMNKLCDSILIFAHSPHILQ